jgi:hypothetical protein
MELKGSYDVGTRARRTTEAYTILSRIARAKLKGNMESVIKHSKKVRTVKAVQYNDPSFKKLSYVRYADD